MKEARPELWLKGRGTFVRVWINYSLWLRGAWSNRGVDGIGAWHVIGGGDGALWVDFGDRRGRGRAAGTMVSGAVDLQFARILSQTRSWRKGSMKWLAGCKSANRMSL